MGDEIEEGLSRLATVHVTVGGDDEPAAPAEAERLGRYAVTGRLGAGGMGEVLAVRDEAIGRTLAAKVVRGRSDKDVLERFILEARITGQLEHPNIVPVHELAVAPDGRVYFTMKRIRGRDLGAVLSADPPPSPAALVPTYLKILDAVRFAHSKGVIHRDLKPANVMTGEFGEVQVMDWGLAKVLGGSDPAAPRLDVRQATATIHGAVVGTPAYMSPEQAGGRTAELDRRSDVYALGAILYHVLALVPPFTGRDVDEVLRKVARGELVPPSARAPQRSIPWELEAVVVKAMAREPDDRYPSVEALQADVVRFLEGRTLGAARYTAWQLAGKWIVRHKAAATAAATILAVSAALATIAFLGIAAERDEARLAQADAIAAREEERVERERAEGATRRETERRLEAERSLADALASAAESARAAGDHRAATLLALRSLEVVPTPRARALHLLSRDLFPPRLAEFAPPGPRAGAVFRPDGGRIAVTGPRGIEIRDASTGARLLTLPAPVRPERVRWSPDGSRLLGTVGGRAVLWDATAARELAALDMGSSGVAVGLGWSPDGTSVLTMGLAGPLRVWSAATGALERELAGPFAAAAFRSDRSVATVDLLGTAESWNVRTGERIGVLLEGRGTILSDEGDRIATFGRDGVLRVLDGGEVVEIGARDRVRIGFGPGGGLLFLADASRTPARLDLYAASTGTWQGAIEATPEEVGSVDRDSISPDGDHLLTATAEGTVRDWDVYTGTELFRLSVRGGERLEAIVAPDGERLLLLGDDEAWIHASRPTAAVAPRVAPKVVFHHRAGQARALWTRSGAPTRIQDAATGRSAGALDLRIEPSDRLFLDAQGGRLVLYDEPGRTAWLWDVGEDREVGVWERVVGLPGDGPFVAGGTRVLLVLEREILLLDAQGGAEVARIPGSLVGHRPALGVFSLVRSPERATWTLTDPTTGRALASGESQAGTVFDPSADGEFVAGWPADTGPLRIWRARSGEELAPWDDRQVAFGPAGRALVVPGPARVLTSSATRVVDLPSRREEARLEGEIHVTGRFAADGNWIVLEDGARRLTLWRPGRGTVRTFPPVSTRLAGHPPRLPEKGPLFLLDGERLVYVDASETARLVDLATGETRTGVPGAVSVGAPTRSRALVRTGDATLVLDAERGEELLRFEGPAEVVDADGNAVYSAEDLRWFVPAARASNGDEGVEDATIRARLAAGASLRGREFVAERLLRPLPGWIADLAAGATEPPRDVQAALLEPELAAGALRDAVRSIASAGDPARAFVAVYQSLESAPRANGRRLLLVDALEASGALASGRSGLLARLVSHVRPDGSEEDSGNAIADAVRSLASGSTPLWREAFVVHAEGAARRRLARIGQAQAAFREERRIDQDGDGRGEFGFLRDLGEGLHGDRGGFDLVAREREGLLELFRPPRTGPLEVGMAEGYLFVVYLPVGSGAAWSATGPRATDADAQEGRFVAYAWPVEYGVTGRSVYALGSADAAIHGASNERTRYGGFEAVPAPSAALRATGPDPAALDSPLGGEGADGQTWTVQD